MQTSRQPRGIVVTLYRGKVVEWWHDGEGCRGGSRTNAEQGGSPRVRVRVREAESWQEARNFRKARNFERARKWRELEKNFLIYLSDSLGGIKYLSFLCRKGFEENEKGI